MKKLFMLVALFSVITTTVKADEGMWLLSSIKNLNYKQMRKQGLKLSAEDIYSVNKASLKDAIVIFGQGCTGEVISDKSLILTNHHCGFDAIQQHSSVEHDYLRDGFWAMSQEQEIATPDLTVTYIKEVIDVTDKVISNLASNLTQVQRDVAVEKLMADIIAESSTNINKYPGAIGEIVPMFGGNQYILFIKQVFPDVRLVGAPPSSIGKFGGDTDNWMWPRHTCDFSMFRVYADANGNPAKYSKNNTPLKAKKSLEISLKGIKDGDYTMIMGFPGRTQRYMTSYEMDETTKVTNANRIYVRGVRQGILLEDMKADPKVKIQYASKYARSSNYWKNSIGMNRGLAKLNVRETTLATEAQFTKWANSTPELKAKYGKALPLIEEAVKARANSVEASQYLGECILSSVEVISMGSRLAGLNQLIARSPEKIKSLSGRLLEPYKDYNMPTDRKVAKAMFKILADRVAPENRPASFDKMVAKFGTTDNLVDHIYNNSIVATAESMKRFIANPNADVLVNDPAYILGIDTRAKYFELQKGNPVDKFAEGHRLFIAGLQEMNASKVYYPDANFTLRLTYGNVLSYEPQDAVTYKYSTTLAGVVAKYDTNNLYEFDVPARLRELEKNKDYGQYATKGKDLAVAFISNNDITGGNSGSPVLNAKGQLIGCAFDGNWEAMSGDIAFEPKLQRTISVDIRYVLFIVDKFAGCTRLIDEMNIVK